MSGLFSRKRDRKVGQLTFPTHYVKTAQKAPGPRPELSLARASTAGAFVELVYRWEADLSWDEADRLDTRARAYVACAIHDAVVAVGLECKPGPNHGIRPTWHVGKDTVPVTLVDAGFDVTEKTCYMVLGAPHVVMGRPHMIQDVDKLVGGFRSEFSKITP